MLILVLGIWGLATRIFYYNKERYIFCGTIALGVLAGVKGYVEGGFYFLVRYNICIDLLSWSLIYLTIWIRGLIILASALIFRFNKFIKEFIFTIIFLSLILILSFFGGGFSMILYFFWGLISPYFFLDFRLGIPAWTIKSRNLFNVLHYIWVSPTTFRNFILKRGFKDYKFSFIYRSGVLWIISVWGNNFGIFS